MADCHSMFLRSTNRRAVDPATGQRTIIEVTQAKLAVLFDYDPDTGVFLHRRTEGRIKAGEQAGAVDAQGYRVLSVECTKLPAHRAAWLYVYGFAPTDRIDHRDHNPANNAIANLREVTASGNAQNMLKSEGKTSRFMGVCWNKRRGKWIAQIKVNYRQNLLGFFEVEEEAAEAYRVAKARFHQFGPEGFHANSERVAA